MKKNIRVILSGTKFLRFVGTLIGLPLLCVYGQEINAKGLDLSNYKLETVYSTDFSNPSDIVIVSENSLFDNGKRQSPPKQADWIYEGKDEVWIDDGTLWIGGKREDYTFGTEAAYHSVIWNTRRFPDNFLLEFNLIQTQKKGLNIVFFAADPTEGEGSIFHPELPKRSGDFTNYTKGAIDSYHISYFATTRRGDPRGFANMRKNSGFLGVANGEDLITETDSLGPHTIRLLKVNNQVTLEVNGRIVLDWTDDGSLGGPPHESGYIGLRQMRQSAICGYADFKVWEVRSAKK